jgi:acetoin utilization deacetylase AcuC-like enzyme
MPSVDPRPLVARDPRFREHVPQSMHPERPERLLAIERALAPLAPRIRDLPPRAATDEQVLRAHARDHFERLRSLAGQRAKLDSDTYAAPASFEVARLAAGTTAEIALRVARGEAQSGFALVRPPGHHAERSEAMGFCLFNNVAIAARALQAEAGVERVAIVDWDVHHGNGTQHLFEAERDVLFMSLHQFPLYPGTGALGEQGIGAGLGSTVNFPLPPGCGDPEYAAVFRGVALPILREFRPQVILVSAGFDAHERDPLAEMRLTSGGFARLARDLRALADEVCGGRVVLALEGGYDLDALGESVAGVVDALASPVVHEWDAIPETLAAKRLREVFREAHARHFRSLRTPTA